MIIEAPKKYADFSPSDFVELASRCADQETMFVITSNFAAYRNLKEVIPIAVSMGELPGFPIYLTHRDFPELDLEFQGKD